MSYLANVSKIASKSLQTCTSGHDEYSQAEPAKPAQSAPNFQKYISISPLVVSDFPEVRQNQANKCLLLTRFDALLPFWSAGGLKECKTQGAENKRVPRFRPFGVPEDSGAWNERMQDSKRLGRRTLGREQINASLLYR